jgi:hypothetical protein
LNGSCRLRFSMERILAHPNTGNIFGLYLSSNYIIINIFWNDITAFHTLKKK